MKSGIVELLSRFQVLKKRKESNMSNTKDNVSINREYKDRLFCLLFGNEE